MKKKKLRQTTWNRGVFGIANHMGDPWTSHTWTDRQSAESYLKDQERLYPAWKLARHRVVPVSVTVRIIATKKK